MRRAALCRRLFLLFAAPFGFLDRPADPIVVEAGTHRALFRRRRIELERLAPGDQVAVHFQSQGCFHRINGDFILTRTEAGLAVEVQRANGNLAPGWHLVTRRTLEITEVRGLDRLLAFYRSDRPSGCTTVERVTFRVLRGNLQGTEERYRDGSCEAFERSDPYPVGALLRIERDSLGMP
jgi:hypothetical protein